MTTLVKLKPLKMPKSSTVSLFILGLPGILCLFIFSYLPMYGLVLPFKNFRPADGIFGSPWVGLDNFRFLFATDRIWSITFNTIAYNFAFIVMNTTIGVLFALLLYELSSRHVKIYQTVYFIPFYISWPIVALLGMGFLDVFGLINQVREFFFLAPVDFYRSPEYWPFILVFINTWKMFGYASVIYYASLMSIDATLFEAAAMDGATKLQQIRYISLPSMIPMIVMINMLALGRVFFGDIGLFYNVTLNSAFLLSSTEIIDTYVLRMLMTFNEIGMASAAGFYQSICGFLLIMASNFIARKISPENALF